MEYYGAMTDDKHKEYVDRSYVEGPDKTVRLVNIEHGLKGCVQGLQLCKNHADRELRVERVIQSFVTLVVKHLYLSVSIYCARFYMFLFLPCFLKEATFLFSRWD